MGLGFQVRVLGFSALVKVLLVFLALERGFRRLGTHNHINWLFSDSGFEGVVEGVWFD